MASTQKPRSIYVMSAGNDRHKVGVSKLPDRRRAALAGASGYDLAVVYACEVEDALAVEKTAHWLLRDFRLHGEWFGVSAEVAVSAVRSAQELVATAPHVTSKAAGPITGRAPPKAGTTTRPLHRLTTKQVEQAKGPAMLSDGGGLYLKVDRSGARRWVFVFFWEGRRREMGLGPARTVHLYEAREIARESRKLVASRVDPIAERITSKAA